MRTVFVGFVIVVIGLLMLCALFMAIKTRKVHIKGLNDAKYIAAMVYVACFCATVHLILTATLKSYVNTFPAVLMGFSMISATTILGLVFIPKESSVACGPSEYNIMVHTVLLS